MTLELYEHQKIAVDMLTTGSILLGGVGSGKSRTALTYYFTKECKGELKINGVGSFSIMKKPKDLYIITTARKRDTFEWEAECIPFLLSTNLKISSGIKVVVDSWNNIGKYTDITNKFFIFDEQRVIGAGSWVKSFLKIVKKNNWVLLTATPGDTWMDYVPVFIANNFYKNRTEFLRRHVVYNFFTKYPKIDHYIDRGHLEKLRKQITVKMEYDKPTTAHTKTIIVPFDKATFDKVMIKRWNVFENKPIKNISETCYLMRKVVNSDPDRLSAVKRLLEEHAKAIVFYSFDYELELLRKLGKDFKRPVVEWNGHKHELIPKKDKWIYLVQYTAGAEGWNCIETNCIIFYSQHYSYRMMTQAAGRIDRLNTTFSDLYYFHIRSTSIIDLGILKALTEKRNFNEYEFMKV